MRRAGGQGVYAPFLAGNARALDSGAKAFGVDTYGEQASYLNRAYPERSAGMIRERIARPLSGVERTEVGGWLRPTDSVRHSRHNLET